jgi:MSHA biogenesis protein MshL
MTPMTALCLHSRSPAPNAPAPEVRPTGIALALLSLALLQGCAGLPDSRGDLKRQDYLDLHQASPRYNYGPGGAPAPAIPALRPLAVLQPTPVDPRLVSVSLAENVPVREAIIMLATRLNMDYDLDPRISGGISMRANERPFSEVIERIADLAGLRFRIEQNRLRVELDEPFHRNYPLGTINLLRRAGTTATSASGSLGSKEGSTSSLKTETQVDFWQEVTLNVSQILKTMEDKVSLRLPIAAEARDVEVKNFQALAYGDGISSASRSTYTVNRQAGLLSLYATERQHREVERYLNSVFTSINQQVQIDARIVEVTLNNRFESSINWDLISSKANILRMDGVTRRSNVAMNTAFGGNASYPQQGGILGDDRLSIGVSNSNVSAIANLLETFGTTRTLSSPRITVMNNQMGLMKVSRDLVYFEVKVQRDAFQGQTSGNVAQNVSTTSTPKTVPVGLVLAVQPSVDPDTRLISLSIRPSVSRVQGFVNDPAVAIEAARAGLTGLTSQIPIVEVREFDSVVNMRSGQVVVMGGLRETAVARNNSGLPGLTNDPLMGTVFGSRKDSDQTTELVIFLRAVLSEEEGVAPADRKLYETFASDPRPLVF